MSTIQLLPEHLINQIAAGEVVERPASMVKELLENAIDADARHIVIEVKDGGESFLRVTDDGFGMDADDAILALERHATSKIATVDDLNQIHTLGFRGEALASIASVSLLTMQTKKRGALEGTMVTVEGGTIKNVKSAGMPEGTQIEVRQLFFNTPARKKYLKNPLTEYNHIFNTVTGIALAFPGVAFRLVHNDKIIFDLPANNFTADEKIPTEISGEQPSTFSAAEASVGGVAAGTSATMENFFRRIRQLMGRAISDELIPVFYGHSRVRLEGFIGKPIIARSNRNMQYLFVNKREIKSHVLSYAVKESYYSLLPKEKYPVFFLAFDMDPELVDVNVHPRKQEVRFVDEREIFRIANQASQKALETHILAPNISGETPLNYYQERRAAPLQLRDQDSHQAYELSPTTAIGSEMKQAEALQALALSSPLSALQNTLVREASPTLVQAALDFNKNFSSSGNGSQSLLEKDDPLGHHLDRRPESTSALLHQERLEQEPIITLAQLHRSYILCQQGQNLVIVDQHAAHERIRYTELLGNFEELKKTSQPLLTPWSLEVSPKELAIFHEFQEMFEQLGFEIEPFGGNVLSIQAIPSYLTKENLQQTLQGLFDDLGSQTQKGDFQKRKERSLIIMACRSAKKFGDVLSPQEQAALIAKLMTLDLPYTCPHGRPTMIVMSGDELKKRFGRHYG